MKPIQIIFLVGSVMTSFAAQAFDVSTLRSFEGATPLRERCSATVEDLGNSLQFTISINGHAGPIVFKGKGNNAQIPKVELNRLAAKSLKYSYANQENEANRNGIPYKPLINTMDIIYGGALEGLPERRLTLGVVLGELVAISIVDQISGRGVDWQERNRGCFKSITLKK